MIDDHDFALLSAYEDGELSAGEALEMERRLATEPELHAMAQRLGVLKGAVREALVVPPASPALRARVVRQIGPDTAAPRRLPTALPQRWRALAATLAIGLFGGSLIGGGVTYLAVAEGDPVADAVFAGHLRGLAAPQPFDVVSSNRHVVKPWFNGRTTIAPEAPDLAADGFPLAGGRIDVVSGMAVPTIVYRRGSHVISVTVVPKGRAAGEVRRDGSTIERWSAGDLGYWAVSDVEPDELRRFADLYRKHTGGKG